MRKFDSGCSGPTPRSSPKKDPRFGPRHLLAQRRLRESLIGDARRAATGQRDREAPARRDRLRGGVDDGAGGEIGQLGGIVLDDDLGRVLHIPDHTLSSRC
jgi:hypothetical protein